MKTGIQVFDAMTSIPVTVPPNTSIRKCTQIMHDEDIGALIIQDKKKVIGIITEKDIIREVVKENLNPEETLVSQIMVKSVYSVEPEEDLYNALIIMKYHRIRHLPVIKNNKLIGVITSRDILKIQPDLFETYAEKYRLRREDLDLQSNNSVNGNCEICGKYKNLTEINGQLLCKNCSKKL